MDSFILFLSKTTSQQTLEFEVNFEKEINISHSSTCGIVEITIPSKCYKISADLFVYANICFEDKFGNIFNHNYKKFEIPKKIYNDIKIDLYFKTIETQSKEFFKTQINKTEINLNKFPKLWLKSNNLMTAHSFNTTLIYVKNNDFTLRMWFSYNEDFHQIFKLNDNNLIYPNIKTFSSNKNIYIKYNNVPPINLKEKILLDTLCIHCDVISASIIDQRKDQILRVVKINNSEKLNTNIINFEKTTFINLIQNNIVSLNISLKDIFGRNVLFESGNLNCVLLIKS